MNTDDTSETNDTRDTKDIQSTFREGHVLFREGDKPDAAYLILSGTVQVTKKSTLGQTPLAVVQKGDVVGEMALFSAAKRTATATTSGEVKAIRLSTSDFKRRLNDVDALMNRVFTILVRRLAEASSTNTRLQAELDTYKLVPRVD